MLKMNFETKKKTESIFIITTSSLSLQFYFEVDNPNDRKLRANRQYLKLLKLMLQTTEQFFNSFAKSNC